MIASFHSFPIVTWSKYAKYKPPAISEFRNVVAGLLLIFMFHTDLYRVSFLNNYENIVPDIT